MNPWSMGVFLSLEMRVREKIVRQQLYCGGFAMVQGPASSGTWESAVPGLWQVCVTGSKVSSGSPALPFLNEGNGSVLFCNGL